jgi:hypothetical protein
VSSFLSALRTTSKQNVGAAAMRHETIFSENFSETNLQNYQPIYYNSDELPNEAPSDDKYWLETVILLVSIVSILLGYFSS